MDLSKKFEEKGTCNGLASAIAELTRNVQKGHMPDVTFAQCMTHPPEGGKLKIALGEAVSIKIHWELGRDPYTKQLVERIANGDMEEEILKLFPDEAVAKKLFDHIFNCYELDLNRENVRLHRYGNTELCKGSAGYPYPDL